MYDSTTTLNSGQVHKLFAYKPELKTRHVYVKSCLNLCQILITVMNAPSGGLGGVRSDDPVPIVAAEAPATVNQKGKEPRF
jgi:hypothetical protein